MPLIKQCLQCTKDFRTYPSKILLGRGKYCSKVCADISFKGKRFSPDTEWKKGTMPKNFKGYRFTKPRPGGHTYKLIYKPEHPNATKSGHVREHRLVMEKELGRYLRKDEIVDHIDRFDTLNNDPSNLRVMLKTEHDRMNVKLNVHRRWVERRANHHAGSTNELET